MLDENLLTLLINHVHNPQRELGRFGQKLQQHIAENNYEIDSKKKIIFVDIYLINLGHFGNADASS